MMVGNKVVLNHTQSNIRDSNVETNGNMNNYMKTDDREFNQLQLSMNQGEALAAIRESN
jgi:hypothetical protein